MQVRKIPEGGGGGRDAGGHADRFWACALCREARGSRRAAAAPRALDTPATRARRRLIRERNQAR